MPTAWQNGVLWTEKERKLSASVFKPLGIGPNQYSTVKMSQLLCVILYLFMHILLSAFHQTETDGKKTIPQVIRNRQPSWQHPRAGIGKQACMIKSSILEWGSTEISKAVCQDYDSLKRV